jgi:hypothetical protein
MMARLAPRGVQPKPHNAMMTRRQAIKTTALASGRISKFDGVSVRENSRIDGHFINTLL